MRLTLRQIQVFAAVAQTGHVTRAAERLSMSQSAASTSLAELERQSKHALFDRVDKRLQLNETGRGALPKALEMLDRAAELETLFAGAAGPGHLRLGASMTIGDYLGPLLIERYARSYPGASVALEVGNTDGVAQKVADFDVDLALIEGQVSNPALEVCDWMGDTLAVFCGSRHPLARTGRATIDRLLKETWVVREPGSGTRQTLDRAMSRYWPRWNIAMELEHTEAIKRAVEAGRSVGCVSRLALRDAFKAGSLKEIKVPRLDLSRRFYILLNRRKYRTAGIDAFMQICQEAQVETLD